MLVVPRKDVERSTVIAALGRWGVCLVLFAGLGAHSLSAYAQENTSLVALEEDALRAAADRVAPAVVQIRTIGGLDTTGAELRADGPTTGLVVSPDGFIVTSTFNFTQQPASILVTFASGKQAPAELVAKDESRMLVLLKVNDVSDLPVPDLVPANEIRVGQWAVAVGRTFRSDQINVTEGIVSAAGRMFGKVLQTDADVSTANYGGPLIDIRGRVFGIIVPMAPQGAGAVAGAEWYDSGIGFAVPLSAIGPALEKMKRGEDQLPGILGIGMSGKEPYSSPAELAAVRPDSPAGLVGLKKGDRIIEVNGRPIKTQTDLRFALGPLYGGDEIRVVAMRDEKRLEKSITLAGKLKAFRHAFLGILPMRPLKSEITEAAKDEEPAVKGSETADKDKTADNDGREANSHGAAHSRGIVVRSVYGGSPAAEAGIRAGDRVVRINDVGISGIADAIAELDNIAPGGEAVVSVERGDETQEFLLTAARLPTTVLEQLPAAHETPPPADQRDTADAKPAGGTEGSTRSLKIAEFKERCSVYVPASTGASGPHGVLLWLAPGKVDVDAVIAEWKPICDRDGVIFVVPSPADERRWERTELEYLRRLLERVIREHRPDPSRIVVYGQEGGGVMAWLLALSSHDVVRGVATTLAPLPRQVRVPENEPAQRLAVFAALTGDEAAAALVAQGLQKLSDAGYPVTTITSANRAGELAENEREEIARWMDALDRF